MFSALKASKNLDEVKFVNVATGDFDSCLKSPLIGPMLRWVIDSDLYLHFFNINLEYWSFIDIIDDCLLWCLRDDVDFGIKSLDEPDELKDGLYRVIRMDRPSFLDLMLNFGYPNLAGKTSEFVEELAMYVRGILVSPAHQCELEEVGLVESIARLCELLEACSGIDDMTLVQEDEEGVLVDAFTKFFGYTAAFREKDNLVMDMEARVKEYLDARSDHIPGSGNIKFVDSKTEPLIQLSDVLTGLLARFLQFVDEHSHEFLGEWLGRLNRWQVQNLDLLRQLIDKSDDRDPMLLFRLVSDSEKSKFALVLYPDNFHDVV